MFIVVEKYGEGGHGIRAFFNNEKKAREYAAMQRTLDVQKDASWASHYEVYERV